MLNGRFDFYNPENETLLPMVRLLGTPDNQKRLVMFDTGHNIPRPDSDPRVARVARHAPGCRSMIGAV